MKTAQFWDDASYRQLLCFFIFISLILIAAGIGLRDPWPADEPRFVEIAKEMVDSGQWFFPTRAGELYPDKPPVFMWLLALGYWLTGSLKWSFLIPSAIAGVTIIICSFDLAAKLWGMKAARNTALLLLITPQFMLQAKAAQIDIVLTAWVILAMYGLIRHYFIQTSWSWFIAAWAFMGLGIITKGVGFLPIFLFLPITYLHMTRSPLLKTPLTLKQLWGPLVMLGVLGLWLGPMLFMVQTSGHPDYISYQNNILFKQTAQRYAKSLGHREPWYYFLVNVLPELWFPTYLVFAQKGIVSKLKASPISIYLLIWTLCVLIFFSISPGKRSVYLLPALPIFAMVAGYLLSQLNWKLWQQKIFYYCGFGLSILGFIAAILVWLPIEKIQQNLPQNQLGFSLLFIAFALIWMGLTRYSSAGLSLVRSQNSSFKLSPFNAYVIGISLTWLLYSLVVYPLLNPIRTPAKAIMSKVEQLLPPDSELGLTRFKEQFILFSNIPFTQFSYLNSGSEQDRNAWQWMKQAPNRYLFTQKTVASDCFDITKGIALGTAHRRQWYLLDATALKSTCPQPEVWKQYHFSPTQNYQ